MELLNQNNQALTPIYSQALSFLFTYDWDAAESPTKHIPSVGALIVVIRSDQSIELANQLPLKIIKFEMKRRERTSFFERFFCCGNTTDVAQPISTVEQYLKANNKDPNLYKLVQFDNYYLDKSKKIKTTHPLITLRISDTMEQNTPNPCPICFRYFNFVLVSQCCFNYICHICALEYKSPKCHFCQNEKCRYMDSDSKLLKAYTDSQGMQMIAMMQRDTTIS